MIAFLLPIVRSVYLDTNWVSLFFYSTLPSALDLIIKSLVLRRNPVSLESSVDMEILNIKRWDTLLEFRRDLRDAHYYQKVWR